MPDTLNKQAIVNLLIDSPLREPIKINLIDIVNNTSEPDLPKVYSTITKELEIFQKATERRMKLAEETIAKLGGTNPTGENNLAPTPQSTPIIPTVVEDTPAPTPTIVEPQALTVPPLDLPPMPTPTPVAQNFQQLGTAPTSTTSDEDALAEIQKELDSLKTEAAADLSADKAGVAAAAAPVTPPQV